MNSHFHEILSSNWLTKDDRDYFARFLKVYSDEIEKSFGSFDWKDNNFTYFCKKEKIQQKGQKSYDKQNHFWFNASKPEKQKTNDFAHHFFRHIRNAFAHGNIRIKKQGKKKQRFYYLADFDHNGVQSMGGVIRADLLGKMMWLLYKTKRIDGRV